MPVLVYGQVLTQLAWTLALAAAPFLALARGGEGEVAAGVAALQLARLLPLAWPGLGRRPGRALFFASGFAAAGLLLAVAAGFAPLAYLGVGVVGVLEGWLIPVLLRRGSEGAAFERASGLGLAVAVATPALAWPAAGALVAAAGPGRALWLAAVFLGLRALSLLPYARVRGQAGARARVRLDGRLYLVFFLLVLPLGTLATRLPGVLGPRGYALYSQLFALGSGAGALLAGRGRLPLPAGGLLLVAGGLALAGGAFGLGGGLYGLGFGALQVAGLGWLGRRFEGPALAATLARFGAAGALGGAAGALLAGTPLWGLALFAGAALGLVTLRPGTRP